jgi:Tfp pilus assembly protein PilF
LRSPGKRDVGRCSRTRFASSFEAPRSSRPSHSRTHPISRSVTGGTIEFLEAGAAKRAEHHFGRAAQLKPRWPEAHIGLGDARFAQGRVEEAIDDYKRGVELAPRKPEGHIHLARALAESGKSTAAEHHFRRAIELGRDSPNAAAHAYLALLFSRTGRVPEAEAQYRRALEIDPSYGEAHANLGFLLIRQRRHTEAKAELDRAIALGHQSAELHFGLGVIELQADHAAAAVQHFKLALERRPDWNLPANNLAWLLATHPDPSIRDPITAIEIAEGLRREGEPLKPRKLDTLAAAYASAGRFAEAGLTAGAAAHLARKAGNDELAARIEQREQLYRSGRPFIESPHPRID